MAIKIKKLKNKKAIKFILYSIYCSKYENKNNLSKSPEGINFYEWLRNIELISQKEFDRIRDEIYYEEEYGDFSDKNKQESKIL